MVLDAANPPQVRTCLRPASERTLEGLVVREHRTLVSGSEGDVVVKDVQVSDATGKTVAAFHEEVSLYERDDLLDMLGRASWKELATLGDYDGAAWTPESPRLIIVAERTPA